MKDRGLDKLAAIPVNRDFVALSLLYGRRDILW
jgi:hypothetical protein